MSLKGKQWIGVVFRDWEFNLSFSGKRPARKRSLSAGNADPDQTNMYKLHTVCGSVGDCRYYIVLELPSSSRFAAGRGLNSFRYMVY